MLTSYAMVTQMRMILGQFGMFMHEIGWITGRP